MIHLATAAIVNAVWDLYAKLEGKPLWKLLADMTPEQIVACIDFRYIEDALTPDEALEILRRNERDEGRARGASCSPRASPPTRPRPAGSATRRTRCRERAREALAAGFTHLKLKVGGDLETRPAPRDASSARRSGPSTSSRSTRTRRGASSRRSRRSRALAEVDPWWIEEPTSPDDILGHRRIRDAVAPVRVATGEHVQNRVVFKQLLQFGAIDVCQVDCCRLGGVNEVLAVVLLAAKFGVPVCPHAGGVGLCEYAQHVSMFDYIAVGATLDDRVCEFVDHLHEHFVDPVRVVDGRYLAPTAPGYSIEIRPESLSEFAFPDGAGWWQEEEVPA